MMKVSPVEHRPGPARIGVLDRNRTVLARVARVASAAAALERVAAETDPAALREQLAPNAQLLLCDGDDAELALEWADKRWPQAQVVAWSHGPMEPLLELAQTNPRLRCVLGWPSFLSMPRAWELTLAVRVALGIHVEPLKVGELFAGVPVAVKYRPRTSAQRDTVTTALTELAERAGAGRRLADRIGETCHELVMNAMYDAPVNHYGQPRYAHDRKAAIELDELEVPTVRLATDGMLLAVQVADPFGRLSRARILSSIRRGLTAAHAPDASTIIDSSHGGAGLGLWKTWSSAAATLVELVAGHTTTVSAVFDLDVGARESRTMPTSLHLYEHGG